MNETSSTDRLREVLADLEAEGEVIDHLVADLDEDGWRLATPAEGWDIATSIAHLAWTDEVAVLAATDKEAWDALVAEAMGDPLGIVDAKAEEGSRAPGSEILARWRASRSALRQALEAHPPGEKIEWFGPPMSPTSMATARFMETWAHGRDVIDALGVLVQPTDRIRHVCHLGVRTRDFAYAVHSEHAPAQEFRVELAAPSGATWTWGPEDAEQDVRGSALDFALLVTQRRNLSDLDLIARGDDAQHWLTIAQAFAGPPGPGRPSGRRP